MSVTVDMKALFEAGVHFIPDIRVVFRAYPLTWSISSGIFLYLFLRGKWVYGFEKRKNRILKSFR